MARRRRGRSGGWPLAAIEWLARAKTEAAYPFHRASRLQQAAVCRLGLSLRFRGGFEPAYNAQAGVDHGSRLIVVNHASPNPNDKRELQPALDNLGYGKEKCEILMNWPIPVLAVKL